MPTPIPRTRGGTGVNYFLWSGRGSSRMNLTQSVTMMRLDNEVTWLSLSMEVENAGDTTVSFDQVSWTVRRVLPRGENELIARNMKDRLSILIENEPNVDWPIVGGRVYPAPVTLKPGEKQLLNMDMEVVGSLQTLRSYAFVPDSKSGEHGWSTVLFTEAPQEINKITTTAAAHGDKP
jgi:hypothetical protein